MSHIQKGLAWQGYTNDVYQTVFLYRLHYGRASLSVLWPEVTHHEPSLTLFRHARIHRTTPSRRGRKLTQSPESVCKCVCVCLCLQLCKVGLNTDKIRRNINEPTRSFNFIFGLVVRYRRTQQHQLQPDLIKHKRGSESFPFPGF